MSRADLQTVRYQHAAAHAEQLRVLLDVLAHATVLAAVALAPVTSLFKVVYALPFTWVDPSLVLGAGALLLALLGRPARPGMLALGAVACLAAYWCSTLAAVGRAQWAGADYYREPVKMTLTVALASAVVLTTTRARLRRIGALLGVLAVVELLWAVYLLASVLLPVPLPGAWREYAATYWFRQAMYSGGVAIPRLGGTFIESPPFGLFMLAAAVGVALAIRASRATGELPPGRVPRIAVVVGMIGSWSSQVLLAAGIWGLVTASPGLLARRLTAGRRALMGGAIVLSAAVAGVVVWQKLVQSPGETTELGASVGERRAHLERSLRLFGVHPVLGVGPGLFGEAALRESNGLYPVTTSVQLLPAELLAEVGLVGTVVFALVIAGLVLAVRRDGDMMLAGAMLAVIVASSFQASWRVPSVAIAIGLLLAGARVLPRETLRPAEP